MSQNRIVRKDDPRGPYPFGPRWVHRPDFDATSMIVRIELERPRITTGDSRLIRRIFPGIGLAAAFTLVLVGIRCNYSSSQPPSYEDTDSLPSLNSLPGRDARPPESRRPPTSACDATTRRGRPSSTAR